MTVYNAEKYLHQAIKSVLNQTFKDFEFLIIDDASTDKSVEIIKSYQAKDPRIVLYQN
ncbi:MAG TPA: glycosyltransferase family A protein, partial [Candidatus Omnitrophota bacterium]|nr:glycosyltransferase family A protein [Candidatus Omnitrophota bacterium]